VAVADHASGEPARRRVDAEILDRQPPSSVEMERAVLGSILMLPEVCDDVSTILRPEHLYDQANRSVYTELLAMRESGGQVDHMLLTERLRASGQLDAIGGFAYLAQVAQAVPNAAHAEHYAKIVRDKALIRFLIHAGTEILRDAYDESVDARDMLSRAEEKVFAILEKKGHGEFSTIREVLQESLVRLDARMKHDHAVGGLETGFADFDDLTGGLHGSELVILAARPSMGKTALAMNIAEHVTMRQQTATLFVSLEMSAIELGDRLLCSVAKVDGHRLRNGTVTNKERAQLVETAAEISNSPLFIDDSPARSMTEIAATARRLKRKERLGLVVIDYLQLIDPDNPRDPRQEQVAKMARRLKRLARELEIPVLCLAQLNRQAEVAKDNKPRLSHLRESGAIEQDADVVIFIHREEYYQTNEEDRDRVRGEAELIISKQRNGPTGDVKLTWRHEFTRFEDRATKAYEEFQPYAAAGEF
jgi:replicative DNA helicase